MQHLRQLAICLCSVVLFQYREADAVPMFPHINDPTGTYPLDVETPLSKRLFIQKKSAALSVWKAEVFQIDKATAPDWMQNPYFLSVLTSGCNRFDFTQRGTLYVWNDREPNRIFLWTGSFWSEINDFVAPCACSPGDLARQAARMGFDTGSVANVDALMLVLSLAGFLN